MKKDRKCFDCRGPVEGSALKCKKCVKKKVKCTAGTLVIYDKI